MILLEEVSRYEGSYEFRIFEEEYEIDLSDRLATVFVYLVRSVDNRIPNLVLLEIEKTDRTPDDTLLVDKVIEEIAFPEEWGNYSVKVLKEI